MQNRNICIISVILYKKINYGCSLNFAAGIVRRRVFFNKLKKQKKTKNKKQTNKQTNKKKHHQQQQQQKTLLKNKKQRSDRIGTRIFTYNVEVVYAGV